MVILQGCLPSLVNSNTQTKHPIIVGSDYWNHEKRSLKLHSSVSPSSLISNSQQTQSPTALFPPINQTVAAIVFGDGPESQLHPLTKRRSEAAIPIAARYRLIDAVVSNCISSNIHRIYALTQFNSTSLNSHISRAYSGLGFGNDGFVEIIAAYQSPDNNGWFQGTADAVRRCLWLLEEYPMSEFLVLPGYHLYKMDYQELIKAHRNNRADITVAASVHRFIHDPGFGFLDVNSENQVLEFRLKLDEGPANIHLADGSSKSNSTAPSTIITSMGIYLINRDALKRLLEEHFPEANDFRSEVIPGAISRGMKVQAYAFDGYWEDMRNIGAFYQANMQTIKSTDVGYNFYDRESPIHTLRHCLPPTLITDSVITDSVVGDGCVLNGCRIKGTVVGMRSRIGIGAIVEDSVIMGSTFYQSKAEDSENKKGADIPIGIGEATQIRKAIVDKNARIGKNVMIINKDNAQEGDREADGYVIREGIVVVLRSAVIPDGTVV
ncbi:inactive glucose-1-phosphate adenylyltransferase small subunit 2, chloroplastic [Argentina anserina]|uniref:inactive glucose-1-phosphate adenylyltransferase small subunit 2, chloroplastic n=1 Tax=Argentina anserina TaxID=57926 RepID=UPI00217674AC|nr:inactive glucose-1-phosphate adenylyltransferase small subunit 2, chloroplastic [Potentilla anserina]